MQRYRHLLQAVWSSIGGEPCWQPGCYYTDASGGLDTAEPLLRGVGLACVHLEPMCSCASMFQPVVRCMAGAALQGSPQTVHRGELGAVIMVLHLVQPRDGATTRVWAGSLFVIGGARKAVARGNVGFNEDRRGDFLAQWRRHGGRIQLH